jgi:hypothetical protein
MSRVIVILTGSREEQCLNKEIDGTGSARTGATPISLPADQWNRVIDE